MKRVSALVGSVLAMTLTLTVAFAPPAMAATMIPIGTYGNPYFFITGQTLTEDVVTANFGATVNGGTSFDDIFTFSLPLNGVGSGSVSTSTSGMGTALTITAVIINGVSEAVHASAFPGISGIPITAGAPDTIEIAGFTAPNAAFGTFTGTFTFTAVPEPATWGSFLLGLGVLGLALRRRSASALAFARLTPQFAQPRSARPGSARLCQALV